MKNDSNTNLANLPTKNKIGFFGSILITIGSSVGAGIFFKSGAVLENSQNSLIFAFFCWIIAAFGVICMALALLEIVSYRNDNLSLIGWCKSFNSKITYKACKNFMTFIYIPLTYFFMPFYALTSIQDSIIGFTNNPTANISFNSSADWAILTIIALVISVYFIFVSGISSKIGNLQNTIILFIKFLPLIFAAIVGFVIIGINKNIPGYHYEAGFAPSANNSKLTLSSLSPGFGMFIAISGIFFAYDGFYVTSGIKSELKEPKKAPMAIFIGLVIVTVIYLIIAISMSIGTNNGGPSGFEQFFIERNAGWVYGLFQLFIGIGVLGIINGFAMWSPKFIEELIKEKELYFSEKLINRVNTKPNQVGIIYSLALTIPIFIIFSIIGGLGYSDYSNYGPSYGTGVAQLYSLCDLMSSWTSVIVFGFIGFAIFGGLRNRYTKKLNVEKSKGFIFFSISSLIICFSSLFITCFEAIFNVFILFRINDNTEIAPRLLTLGILILFILIMFLPILSDYLINKKKVNKTKKDI